MTCRELPLWVVLMMTIALSAGTPVPESRPAPTVESHLKHRKFLQTYINMRVQGLTRQYGLAPDQTEAVRRILMKEDWKAQFQAAGQLEAFDRAMRQRIAAGTEPSVAEVRAMAEKLSPVCRRTLKDMMLRTLRIHRIMTPDQQRLHRNEIDEMEADSAELNNRLDRWKAGGLRPGELAECFGPDPEHISPVREQTDLEKRLYSTTSFDFWDLYVKAFIEAFQLDAGQIPMAYSVLNDTKALAHAYRKDHESEFAHAERELADFRGREKPGATGTADALADRRKRLEKLNRPLLDLFDQLKTRLMKIPTDRQRRAALDVLGAETPGNEGKKDPNPALSHP